MSIISTYIFYSCLRSEGDDGTPLACAASKGHVKIINYLLEQNVDINGGIKVCRNCNTFNNH